MDTNTIIRVSEPRELLAYIPFRLGFHPRESLVLLSLRRPRNRVGLVIRADLADVGHAVAGPDVARGLVRHMHDDGAQDGLAVVYTDRPRADLASDPVLVRALAHVRAAADWFDPPGPWVVGPQGYGCWGPGAECDLEAAPLQDLEQTQMGAAMVLAGRAVVPEREALAVRRTADGTRRRATLRAAGAAQRRYVQARRRCGGGAPVPGAAFGLAAPTVDDETPRGTAVAGEEVRASAPVAPGAGWETVPGGGWTTRSPQEQMLAWRHEEIDRWHRLLVLADEAGELPAGELGRMLVGLSDVAVRDAIILSMVGAAPGWVDEDDVAAWALGSVFEPGGRPPAPEVTEPAEVVLRQVAAGAARGKAAPALVLLAWLAWWEGDGARADVLSQQCLEEHPGHRLGTLVASAVQHGVPPGWVSGV